MSKLKFYKIAAIALLILNVIFVAFHFTARHHHQGQSGRQLLNQSIQLFDFDEQQKEAFDLSARTHHAQIDSIASLQKNLLAPIFNEKPKAEDLEADPRFLEYKNLEGMKVEVTASHFREVKTLLKPAQLQHFDEFVKRAAGIILKNNSLKKARHKGAPKK